jgi:hypothetical protein
VHRSESPAPTLSRASGSRQVSPSPPPSRSASRTRLNEMPRCLAELVPGQAYNLRHIARMPHDNVVCVCLSRAVRLVLTSPSADGQRPCRRHRPRYGTSTRSAPAHRITAILLSMPHAQLVLELEYSIADLPLRLLSVRREVTLASCACLSDSLVLPEVRSIVSGGFATLSARRSTRSRPSRPRRPRSKRASCRTACAVSPCRRSSTTSRRCSNCPPRAPTRYRGRRNEGDRNDLDV